MSVYTRINQQQLEEFLTLYSLGTLVNFIGIQAGIENTNYSVTTTQNTFILTIFESLSANELPCFLLLLDHLSQHDFPSPRPQVCRTGQFLNTLKEKPAALFNYLPGQSLVTPSINQCGEIGYYLAKLHLDSRNCNFHKQNPKNLGGCLAIFDKIKSYLPSNDIQLIQSEFIFQSTYPHLSLPKGIIHADLFRDNVLLDQGRVSGIVDFYNACNDCFLYDIAVTSNDWCIENEIINSLKYKALLSAYNNTRTFTDDEIKHLPVFLRLTALRFWLSRLDHQLNPKTGELTLEKDPLVFRRILEYHRANDSKGSI